jgi:hypothetical protein
MIMMVMMVILHCHFKKVDFSVCLVKYRAMKAGGGMEVLLHTLLTWAVGGGRWLVSLPGRLVIGEELPVPIG